MAAASRGTRPQRPDRLRHRARHRDARLPGRAAQPVGARLAADLLYDSRWEAGIAADGSPTITLVIDSPDLKDGRYSASDMRALPQEMYRLFYRRIDVRLRNTDIFDYLLWLRENKGIGPGEVVRSWMLRPRRSSTPAACPKCARLFTANRRGMTKKT